MKKQGFTQIPHGLHKRFHELTSSEFMVWMVHRSLEGKGQTSNPSLSFIKSCTGMNPETIKKARKGLKAKGWLETTGQVHTKKGHYTVPIMQTVIPTVVGKTDDGLTGDGQSDSGRGGFSDYGQVGKTVVGFLDPEVVTSFEVATKDEVDTEEVDCGSAASVLVSGHQNA